MGISALSLIPGGADTGSGRSDGSSRKEVIFVTTLLERPKTEVTRMPRRTHVTEIVIGAAGVLAAMVGAWMYYVPTDWFLGGLAEAWYLGMFVGAGALLAIAFGLFARNALREDGAWTNRVTGATVIAVLALAAGIAFALVWIL
jgi:hypothetical protein